MQKERKKRVSVTFVKDDDVVQHILHIEDKKSDTKRRAAKRSLSYSSGVAAGSGKKKWIPDNDVIEDSSDDDDNPARLSALGVEENSISGNAVFSFRTPKRSGLMARKASEIRDSLTPGSSPGGKGPTRKVAQSGQRQTVTPQRDKRSATTEGRAPQTTTPYRLRKRNAVVEDSSDEDSVGAESDDDDSDDDEDTERSCQKQGGQPKTLELTTNAEEYFDLHASAVVTSDRTLCRLDLGRLDSDELRAALHTAPPSPHTSHRAALRRQHTHLFRRWMFNMCNGFNVLLFGVGSKRDLIEQFRKQYLTEFSHLVVNGYFPSLTIKQVLGSITEDILGHQGTFRSPLDHVEFIRQRFETQDYEDFYLLIHNVDGAMLRGERTQNVLSLLAQISGVHVLASVDHVNAPLIWDQTKLSRFQWVWQDVTTFTLYLSETSYENSLLVQQSGGLALRSLAHVMRSLTPNARKIFELLAQYQVENADNSAFIGMSFQDLYVRCRESFLVNSDQTLRAQLVEFRDHKLIRVKKNYDGVEHLLIPIESSALKEFLEQGDH
ncbi:origin recognition complex subunit 2-like isoform X2 [Babylonia areolata]|uniref:origin recognition complex subunit 2-like isoform X2 n=1 Tax=Babylonia areolata TaxID=304850 RepID=UPI003FD1749C